MRKTYLDNVRCGIVLLVIFYHVIYLFNSLGIIRNVDIPGIPQMDVFLYLVYPWFMVCLFVIAGISARYALEKVSCGQYLRTRAKKILVPSIAGIFILGWTAGWVTNQYADMFMGSGSQIPGFVKYLIYCISGIGPLWFLHELMLATLILALLRKIDKNDRLWSLGGKTNLLVLFLLVFAVWGSAQILNTPLMEIYRNGIYIFTFLLGYYVFSHEKVQELLQKRALPFLGIAIALCVIYTVHYWGENYSTMENLKSFLTNLYAWFGTLAVLGCGKKFFDKETAFTRYMRPRSFRFYVLHLPLMVMLAYLLDRRLHVPAGIWMYVLVVVGEMILLPVLAAVVRKIPVVNRLLLGEKG